MIKYRFATPQDETQVFRIFSRLDSRQRTDEWVVNQATGISVFHKILGDPELGIIIVAVEGDRVHGVISLSYPVAIRCSGKYARLEEFIVDEDARGRGIGTELLEAAINAASSAGCYDLQVNNPSVLGKAVYSKLRFIEGGEYWRKKLP